MGMAVGRVVKEIGSRARDTLGRLGRTVFGEEGGGFLLFGGGE